jgi:hypothetical protein
MLLTLMRFPIVVVFVAKLLTQSTFAAAVPLRVNDHAGVLAAVNVVVVT